MQGRNLSKCNENQNVFQNGWDANRHVNCKEKYHLLPIQTYRRARNRVFNSGLVALVMCILHLLQNSRPFFCFVFFLVVFLSFFYERAFIWLHLFWHGMILWLWQKSRIFVEKLIATMFSRRDSLVKLIKFFFWLFFKLDLTHCSMPRQSLSTKWPPETFYYLLRMPVWERKNKTSWTARELTTLVAVVFSSLVLAVSVVIHLFLTTTHVSSQVGIVSKKFNLAVLIGKFSVR